MNTDDNTIRQAYRDAAQGEPGPQLDARILQAAHAALETSKNKPARWSWLVLPFSAAAVAILVTTLVLQLRPTPSTPALESASAPPLQAAKPEVAAALPPEPKIAAAQPAKKAESAKPQDQDLRIATAEPAEKALRREESAKQTAVSELTQQRKQERQIASAEPASTRSAASAPAAQPAPSGGVAPLADAASVGVGAAAIQEEARPKAAYAPPPAAPVASAAPAPKLEALNTLSKARAPAQPSEKQVEDIRKLQREGKLEAAKKVLADLRKQFPHYKVPEDLRGLIEPATEEK